MNTVPNINLMNSNASIAGCSTSFMPSFDCYEQPYVYASSMTNAGTVIPSNVFAPQTLPLHSPQPLSFVSSPPVSFSQAAAPPPAPDPLGFLDAGTSGIANYNWNMPSNTFPTPCELLHDLSSFDAATAQKPQGCETPIAIDPAATADDGNSTATRTPTMTATRLKTTERRRRPHQEILAACLGFEPTDPDRISTHDKKRYYLDSLEQYVLYLHNQLRLIGVEPVPIERVSSSRGLSSRSIRTMLVHMQGSATKLRFEKIEAEKKLAEIQFVVEYQASQPPPQAQPVYPNHAYSQIQPTSHYSNPGTHHPSYMINPMVVSHGSL